MQCVKVSKVSFILTVKRKFPALYYTVKKLKFYLKLFSIHFVKDLVR